MSETVTSFYLRLIDVCQRKEPGDVSSPDDLVPVINNFYDTIPDSAE